MSNTITTKAIPMIARFTQSVCAFLALVLAGASFKTQQSGTGHTIRLGSSEVDFILLITFTTWMITMGWIVAFFGLKQTEPKAIVTLAMDGLLAFFLFCGAIALAVSDYVSECDSFFNAIHCRNIKASTAFTFFTFFAVLVTFVWNGLAHFNVCRPGASQEAQPTAYYGEARTPVGAPSVVTMEAATPTPPIVQVKSLDNLTSI